MTSLPVLPSEQQAALALGHQRFQRYIEQLGRRLASTTTFANEITEHLVSHSPKPNAPVTDGSKSPPTDSALKTQFGEPLITREEDDRLSQARLHQRAGQSLMPPAPAFSV